MPKSGYTFLTEDKNNDSPIGNSRVTLSVKGRDGATIQTYSIPSPSLVSEQLSSTADGSLRLTLNYVGHQ